MSYNDRATARVTFIRDSHAYYYRGGSRRDAAGRVSSSLVLLLVVGVLKQVASELLRHPALLGVLNNRDVEVGAEVGKVLLLALLAGRLMNTMS